MTTQLTPNLIAVDVAPDGKNFIIKNFCGELIVEYDTEMNFFKKGDFFLPNSQWRILGIARDVKEEEAMLHVEERFGMYFNYMKQFSSDPSEAFVSTATESLTTLLRSKGLDMNVLLIEKV